jgi:F0F1-type ATP synthase membrane subunit b/b'
METRELYRQKYEAQIHEWRVKIEVLQAQADKLTAQAKIDARSHVDAVHAKLESANAKLHEIAEATVNPVDALRFE